MNPFANLHFDLNEYALSDTRDLRTPALLIYQHALDNNIEATLRLCSGDANRWRPHVKTVKLPSVMRRMMDYDIHQFKCATPRELQALCESGARDVLLAFPMFGANAARVCELADRFTQTRVSVVIESIEQIAVWRGSRVSLFIDMNPGMNRTGIEQARADEISAIASAIHKAGIEFRGLHYYDGHYGGVPFAERSAQAHVGYDQLMRVIAGVVANGVTVNEVITSGTPAFPCALTYAPFRSAAFVHRVSPGTVAFVDTTTLLQLPAEFGYKPAAIVAATVISRPRAGRFTCDGGHKSVAADLGSPTCAVIGHPEYTPMPPSEEHLPVDVPEGAPMPQLGDVLYLVPRHVCPTVNMQDDAAIVREGRVERIERIVARGHDVPLANLPDERHVACILVTDSHDNIVLHLRDDKLSITHPNTWALFGGRVEADETPLQAAAREINEELSLSVATSQLREVGVYPDTFFDRKPFKATYYVYECNLSDDDLRRAVLTEGRAFKAFSRFVVNAAVNGSGVIEGHRLAPVAVVALRDYLRGD
jgi:D-serine deaminase-like pyridoxal phosphate-dependent protein/8-oxo-dGTP pyrophosphatase MutT (NUDIX family)